MSSRSSDGDGGEVAITIGKQRKCVSVPGGSIASVEIYIEREEKKLGGVIPLLKFESDRMGSSPQFFDK